MVKPLGGRGKKAPYETIQMRVPLPIKSQVEQLIEQYRNQVLEESSSSSEQAEPVEKPVDRFSELEIFVQEVLSDPKVTRSGKDRGAVKRGLETLLMLIRMKTEH